MSELLKYKKDYDEGISISEIAQRYNTYPNKIRRMFIKAGIEMRSKNEAQKLALQRGSAIHPTAGKPRPPETKAKISDGIAGVWKNMTPEEALKRKEVMSKIWHDKPQAEKDEMFKKAAIAVAKAGKEGSKTEIYIGKELQKLGYNVIIHKKSLISNTNLELDILIPEYKLVIEIDGPTHFLPIWGEEALEKRIAMDAEKNGLLLAAGYSIIRAKCFVKNMTKRRQRIAFEKILKVIQENSNNKNYLVEVDID